jgi:hypothetical protein
MTLTWPEPVASPNVYESSLALNALANIATPSGPSPGG